MGIRTAKGDKGMTGVFAGGLIAKDSDEVNAMGELDELNSYLGLIKSKVKYKKDRERLEAIQRAVCIIASEISISSEDRKRNGLIFKKAFVDDAQSMLFDLESKVRIGRHFYMPGETELSAFMDIARSVARRAERSVAGLFRKARFCNDNILSYLNCISDILFIMARAAGGGERRSAKTGKRRK